MLPKVFKPKFNYDLLRIGSDHDGGYLIEKSSMHHSDFLFSFGISTNWDFEKEFLRHNSIKLMAFDGSIDNHFWRNQKKIALKKFKKLSFKYLYIIIMIERNFKNFFNSDNFQCKFISSSMKNSITFNEAVKFSDYENNFFKIDIEGSEYEILEDMINFQNKINGIAIEFHNCRENIDRIVDFVGKIKLEIVHIHANNYDEYKYNEIPQTLEISFAKNPNIIGEFNGLPHPFDSPNRSKSKEIELTFND